jgi:ribosome maturation factor RimP
MQLPHFFLCSQSGSEMPQADLERELEERIEQLGYELVELERAGSRARPILRLRVDRPDSELGQGVTLEDCTRISRALETHLDEREDVAERYVLEVSSPGVERPLVRPRDFERFAGRPVALHGRVPLHEGSKRFEGELVGLEGEGSDAQVVVRVEEEGEAVRVPRSEISKIHLVYRWEGGRRSG